MSEGDYRVADISLADFGRREIDIAEHEVSVISWTCAARKGFSPHAPKHPTRTGKNEQIARGARNEVHCHASKQLEGSK